MNLKEVIVNLVLEGVNEIVKRDRLLKENVSDIQETFLKTLEENLEKFVVDKKFTDAVLKEAIEQVFEERIDKPVEQILETVDNETLQKIIKSAADELISITVAESYFEKQLESDEFQIELEKDVYLDEP